ncbi:ribosomal-protein-alanine acetyltransferase [Companilactobacillus sp. RD055328]|uniref:ribosomal protein S18-alanine N-acetyltransferase n=1 Tax=Companilactobacillus sp. RD055328 TaxID=2916634 RepID=UPI001FC8E711|nr:ribosomal protein S18-alanine N-acetyltransferase [Companilactobacillus sp. RD055328]GKQ42147.1 ribosomal-protein-alanine acetyltransferase [Companilactobacillus sp. RD055328]
MFKEFKKLFLRPFLFTDMHLIHDGLSLDITTASIHDLDEVMTLQSAVYLDYQPWTRQTYMYELTRRSHIYLLVKTNDQIIAILGISTKNIQEAHITNISVLPSFQNKGLGHLLLDICFKLVREADFSKLTLEVDAQNTRAIKLYKSLGFYETKSIKNYYDNGHDGLELCKHINK